MAGIAHNDGDAASSAASHRADRPSVRPAAPPRRRISLAQGADLKGIFRGSITTTVAPPTGLVQQPVQIVARFAITI